MSVAIITGSAGLIGSEAVRFFCKKKFDVIGIDNNLRKTFFGEDACTEWNRKRLEGEYQNYFHYNVDIRDNESIEKIFKKYEKDIVLIIHTAAQPSHDWAASNPFMDFTVNANGTLVLLENFRQYCPEAAFIFTSTNKVYGDLPNFLPLIELDTRYELDRNHKWYDGIDETMSIDQSMHSLFGASKVAGDILVQEYGRYFGLKTATFRGGCLTGPAHSGTMLHGFLSYLMRCCILGKKYYIYGCKGKQVRDNIHSYDLVNMFWHFYQNPRCGEVYNVGGSRYSNCSMLEAIEMCQEISGKKLNYEYVDKNRAGDHIWWISSVAKFKEHYSDWNFTYNTEQILEEICQQGHF
ncbi:MAG: NAD-dependent epimerase/dehydratase family protein [Candidatus Bathyarchaeota archaeon]|nr:NAD-dependent epimerase/dehydratase family protein [Candidatus Bathyarchaeota archaeon]